MSLLKQQVEKIAQDSVDAAATDYAPAAQGATIGSNSTTTVGIVTVNTTQIIINGVTLTVLVV